MEHLSGNFFQDFLIDIEVRVHVLHVVMIFERLNQADHGMGIAAL
jgi:hypothetical protein